MTVSYTHLSALVQDQTAVGLLPQPFVTTALMKNDKLKVALDLNKLWEEMCIRDRV